ncbi:MAG: electron transfer flavoprotein subunit beta/FixA family protein [Anaerolineales bacterium]
MKIVVCVKTTLPSEAQVRVEGGQLVFDNTPQIINPWDEYAVEAALQQKEALGGTVTALSLGNEQANVALKHALAMGADDAIRIGDPALAAIDTLAAARLLAAAIRKLGGVDLVCFGRQAIDGDSGVTPAQTARLLGWPALTLASAVKIEAGQIRVERSIEEGRQIVTAALPAVLSVVKDFAEPRYPTFMGKRKADRAEIPVWSLADLGLPAPAALVTWGEFSEPPRRTAQCEMIAGASPAEIAEKLADKILAEKIL